MSIGATELGEALGVSRAMIYLYVEQGKISREPDGQFDLAKVKAQLKHTLGTKQGGVKRRGEKLEAVKKPASKDARPHIAESGSAGEEEGAKTGAPRDRDQVARSRRRGRRGSRKASAERL